MKASANSEARARHASSATALRFGGPSPLIISALILVALTGCFSAQPIDEAHYACGAQIDCLSGFVCYQGYCCQQDRTTGLCVDNPCFKEGTDNDKDGFPLCAGDCDDNDPARFPGAAEICDGKDNNCDGTVDEGAGVTRYRDEDADGHGSSAPEDVRVLCASAANGPNLSTTNDDCDDTDPRRFGGNPETCDGVDNDCNQQVDDGATSTFYEDDDGDGFGRTDAPIKACAAPAGYSAVPNDCQDQSPNIHPGAAEECNGFDDDCDGITDEGVQQAFFPDGDGDGFGRADAGTGVLACAAPQGFAANAQDCDDGNAQVNPNSAERCNDIDDNCNGAIDEGLRTQWFHDVDNDQYGTNLTGAPNRVSACSQPDGGYVARSGDCDDANAAIHPGAAEVCDGKDNNCDGFVDEGVTQTFFRDSDNDGFGDPSAPQNACTPAVGPPRYVTNAQDCNDDPNAGGAASFPGAPESCDGKDNDCDGVKDNAPKCGPRVDQAEVAAVWGAQTNAINEATATISGCIAGTANGSDIPRTADTTVKAAGAASIRADGMAADFFLYWPANRSAALDLNSQKLLFKVAGDAANWTTAYHQPVVLFCGPTGWARFEPSATNLSTSFSQQTLTIPANTVPGNGYTYGGTFSWSRVDWVELHVNSANAGNTSEWVDDFYFVPQ
ncbi:MAG: putative metal-binding motif-containing protein [Myxococcaceae bacterium]